MKKYYSILSLALSLFFLGAVASSNAQPGSKSDVSVSRTVSAAQMAADGRPMVVVTITIKKFAFTGPGKIEEDFSSDFQATVISGNRASFQSGGGKAYFTWNNIQEDRTVTVSYALEALGKTGNSQTITGQFFYQNQAFPIAASSFTIDASNLPAYKAPAVQEDRSPLDDVFVAVTGNYMDGTKPATAAPAAPAPASNNVASASSSTQPAQQPPSTTSAPMQTTSSSAPVTSSAPIQTTSSSAPVTTTPVASTSNPTTDNSSANQQSSAANNPSTPQNNSNNQQQQTPPVANNSSTQQSNSNNNSSPTSVASSAPVGGATAPGLVYRVQIIVVGDKSKLSGFLRHYNITEQPVYDPADGTPVRVMVGNYADYNAAKARATDLKNKGLAGAFVAPYYNGQRISMSDAASHTAH